MMNDPRIESRRDFFRKSIGITGFISLSGLLEACTGPEKNNIRKLKIVTLGGHPDDPESGCGGTMAMFAAAGHDVTIIYLTRGEAGIEGKTHEEAASIRTTEAQEACKILGVKALFAGQTDGDTIFNEEWIQKMQQIFQEEKPDIVFAHWPLDSHKDHQTAGMLAYQVWMRSEGSFDLYFFEVNNGIQTMGFNPTDFINISAVKEQKKKAVYSHQSQHPDEIYSLHGLMEKFRGAQIRADAAEAFVKLVNFNRSSTLFD